MSYIIKSEDKTRLHEIGEPLHRLKEETFFFFFFSPIADMQNSLANPVAIHRVTHVDKTWALTISENQ